VETGSFTEKENAVIEAATAIAREAHRGQTRATPGEEKEPYVNHPLRVADFVLKNYGIYVKAGAAMICAAILHDVLEDCPLGTKGKYAQRILINCGPATLGYVEMLSKPEPGYFRNQRYKAVLLVSPPEVLLIKLADRTDNLTNLVSVWGDNPKRVMAYLSDAVDLYEIAASRSLQREAAPLEAAILAAEAAYEEANGVLDLQSDSPENKKAL